MSPQVTICMPAYNSAAYIEKSIETVHAQRFRDYELIVVNDGSTDNTGSAAAELIKKYDINGCVLTIDNSGPEAARDYGFSHAKGQVFATIDSDDLWDSEFLHATVAVLNRWSDVGICFSDFDIVYQKSSKRIRKSETVEFFKLDQGELRDKGLFIFTPQAFFRFLLQGMLLFPSCTVVRRSIYEKSGGYTKNFDRQISCDWDYALRISREAPTAYVDKVLMTKIFYENNVSIDGIKTALSDIVVLNKLLDAAYLSAGERRIAKRRLAGRMYNVGYGYLETDNYLEARKWFRKSFYENPSINNIKFLILTSMHSRLFAYLRHLKRSQAS